jgi:phosphatidylserine decarboxylase
MIWQYLYPHKLINKIAYYLGNSKILWLKNFLIKIFIKKYKVDLAESKIQNIKNFKTFNHFFTRKINRKIILDNHKIIAPADGIIQSCGKLNQEDALSIKKRHFLLNSLLADNKYFHQFTNGQYCTIYLAPKDYHRVHMPYIGKLLRMQFVPGKLFSVNNKSTNKINNIFSRNERIICYFESPIGIFAVILVGAIIVGSISTVWDGLITPPHRAKPFVRDYHDKDLIIKQGAELGFFAAGSTVITLLPNGCNMRFNAEAGSHIRMGDFIAFSDVFTSD